MGEILRVYNLNGKFLRKQDRDSYYLGIRQEYLDRGSITSQVKVVRFLLMTDEGRIYIQKRSHSKGENAGLYDKTVGGHVKAGFSWNLAATIECQEELAIPMQVVSDSDFKVAREEMDLRITGMMRNLGRTNNDISIRRLADGSFIEQPLMVTYYIGFYNGSIRFKDGESTGVQTFSLKELEDFIRREPKNFTDDLKSMVNRFRDHLVPLKEYKTLSFKQGRRI